MQKDIKILIVILFLLNIVIQSVVNLYIFSDQRKNPALKQPTLITDSSTSSEYNTDLHSLLTDINYKLDVLNQYLIDTPATPRSQTFADIEPHTSQLNKSYLRDTKNNLMSDMSRYDMNIAMFLTDSRLNSLPEQDKQEILSELARRLDSGEINKATFLPGYKPK